MSEPFDMKMDYGYLTYSPILGNIDSNYLDKSYDVEMTISPILLLNLRLDIYTVLCRVIDLNFSYTDYLENEFLFYNEEEYFRSTE